LRLGLREAGSMQVNQFPIVAGKRILVVEDEPMISLLIEDILFDLGCVVVGPASTLGMALELAASEDFDAAILDVQLGREVSFPLADVLNHTGIPFAFATGYGDGSLPLGSALLRKPYSFEGVLAVLSKLLLGKSSEN